ncbi:MAG: B12-binding domain-containing radical SAM protein [Bryobacteraceae bacterium]|nr:B12-binding domain-containing radical SAM protein [Bryobacteraceae bacterium]
MDLLLTHGYFLFEDPKELRIMKPYAPLGLLYLSSYLRRKGFAVEVYDTTFGTREELFRLLETEGPAVLGLSGNLLTRKNVIEIAQRARRAGWIVVLGGPEPANYPREYLEAGAHVIVEGEGEATLEEVLLALRGRGSDALEQVPGLWFRDSGGRIVRTAPRPLIADLDSLPWPDRERVDLRRYLQVWREHHGAGSLSLITARGCPYHCRWCSHSVFGKTHRRRSPEDVAAEVEWLLKRYQPDMLWYADDVFTIHPSWILRFAELMGQRRLRVPFECITRADRLNPQLADALAELGCFRVWIGSESGSQRILDAMERGVRVEQVREAIGLCRQRGIQTGMFLMWGYEGEDIQDIEATVAHVVAAQPDVFLTTVAYPIKGTPYYDDVAARLVLPEPWRQSTDRDYRIAGRHSRRFYEFADLWLRSAVALSKLESESPQAGVLQAEIERARRGLAESYPEVEA